VTREVDQEAQAPLCTAQLRDRPADETVEVGLEPDDRVHAGIIG